MFHFLRFRRFLGQPRLYTVMCCAAYLHFDCYSFLPSTTNSAGQARASLLQLDTAVTHLCISFLIIPSIKFHQQNLTGPYSNRSRPPPATYQPTIQRPLLTCSARHVPSLSILSPIQVLPPSYSCIPQRTFFKTTLHSFKHK